MTKLLKKREKHGQKSLQLYIDHLGGCDCSSCSGCASTPSDDYNNVKNSLYLSKLMR